MATPLERYVRGVVGPCRVVAHLRSSGPARVLEVEDGAGGRWIGKRNHVERLWLAEMQGYAWWGGLGSVPRLHHHHDGLQAIVTSVLPGRKADPRDPEVFEAAGALLRELHRAPVGDCLAPGVDDWLATTRVTLRFERDRARRTGVEIDPQVLTRCLDGLAAFDLAVGPTHGDFAPHNWLVDATGALRTFDFAEAALRPPVHDLVRLRFGPCWDRPDLWAAFLRGYGRPLSPAEERFISHQLVVSAVVALGWGGTHGREDVRARGFRALALVDRATGAVRQPRRRRTTGLRARLRPARLSRGRSGSPLPPPAEAPAPPRRTREPSSG